MRHLHLTLLIVVALLVQPACIWKLWSKGPPPEKRQYDIYGTVESISSDQLMVNTKQGRLTFLFGPASVKGSDTYEQGQVVHVLYKKLDGENVVTLVVKKVN
jgi:hypothetical protein